MLTVLLSGMGVTTVHARHAADNEAAICQALRELHDECDLIVTTGGASVGERDPVRAALTSLGATFVFAGVRMKPGKPVAMACCGSLPVVVLPGNPGAAITTFVLLVTPLIRRLQGRAQCLPPAPSLPVDFDSDADPTRERFLRVHLAPLPDVTPRLGVALRQGAGNLLTLTETTGLSRLPSGRSIARGDLVSYHDFARWLV